MAFTRPTLPFKLTAEDMGVGNLPKAATQGASYVDELIKSRLGNLQAQKAKIQLPYAEDEIKSQIAIRNAQAYLDTLQGHKLNQMLGMLGGGMGGDMSGGMGGGGGSPSAQPGNWQSSYMGGGADAGTDAGASADSGYDQQTYDQSSSDDSDDSSPIPNVNNNDISPGIAGQSYYGVRMPMPTQQQMAQKAFGFPDTYTASADLAKEQQKNQIDAFNALSDETNKSLTTGRDALDKFNQFSNSMKGVWAKGQTLGHIPGVFSSNQRDTAAKQAAQMSTGGIELFKNAMGNARFSQMEAKYSIDNLSPNLTWSSQAIREYGQKLNAATERMDEINTIVNFYKNNPQLGVNAQAAKTLVNSYINQFPIIDPDTGKVNQSNKGKFALYLTKDAITAAKHGLPYKPRDDSKTNAAIKEFLIKNNYYTPKDPSQMTRQEAQEELARLKAQGAA